MYIRRKVFSVAIDQTTGQERLFSTTEIVSEEAYLKMFSSKDDAKGAAKGAAVGAGVAGLGAAGMYGAGKLGKVLKNRRELADKATRAEAESVVESLKKDAGLMKLPVGKKSLAAAEEKVKNLKPTEASRLERYATKAGRLLKNNKKTAAVGAAGLAGVTGIAGGVGRHSRGAE